MTGTQSPTTVSQTSTSENESEAFSTAFKLPSSKEDWAILVRETFGARSAIYRKNANDRLPATTVWRKGKETLRKIASKRSFKSADRPKSRTI